jgi:two-component system chemotaxis sensor kinase CheA
VEIDRRVEQISALVAELRQALGDGPKTRALLDSIFRSVHTFKAAAAAEGLEHARSVAHSFEDLLQDLRSGKTKLDEDVLRVFEDTTAALRGDSDTSTLLRTTPPSDESGGAGELPAEFSGLRDEERHRAVSALREGAKLYVMEAVFEVSDFDERFRSLKEQLEKNAELISSSPTMQDDKIIFQVVYASKSEKIPLQTVFRKAILAGQSLAVKLGKDINFVVEGDELLLDRSSSQVLADALLHLVRNAVDHGIENHGKIILAGETVGEQTEVSVTDDGRGITLEDLPLIFQPGFSTAKNVSQSSGHGVGLDAVRSAVEEFGGSVSVTSEPGKGSSFKIIFPNQFKSPNPS